MISAPKLVLALVTMAFSAQASALPSQLGGDCRLRMESSRTNWLIEGHDAFDPNPATGLFDLILNNDGPAECRLTINASTDSEPFGLSSDRSDRVAYSLVDHANGDNLSPTTGRNLPKAGQHVVVVPGNAQAIVRIDLLTQSDFPGDGLFSQQLRLEATAPDGTALAERAIQISVRVDPSASMALSGAFKRTGSIADIDLGELTTGIANLPLNLRIKSTRGYSISVSSLNDGLLRMTEGDWSVPYRIAIAGTLLNASGGRFTAPAEGRMRNDVLPIAFQIGETTGRRAGRYSDVLTLTVAVD